MTEYEKRANSVPTQGAGPGEHKSASMPAELERGRQTPAEAGDLTPTPSRPTSPYKVNKSLVRDKSASANGADSVTALTNGASSQSRKADRTEVIDRLHAASDTRRGPSGTSTVNDSHPPSSPGSTFLSHSLTPALPMSDTARAKDMPDSAPQSASPSVPSGPSSSRRQQQPQPQSQHQQRSLQPYGYYTSPSPSEPGFSRNPPPISSQGGHQPFAHSQQPTTVQRPAGFVGQYTMSPPPSSLYPPHQVQHQYSYPQLTVPGMPPLPHTHSHTPPEFYPVGHSASSTQPPLYAPTFHTGVPQEHAPTPALAFDYDRSGNPGRNPSTGSNSPYTPQQPFASYNLHPTITATPQFTHSHSPFSPPYPAQQSRHTHQQYPPPSYAYMTRTGPSSEDTSQPQQQASATWWFIPPGASHSTGPYPSVYYVDAYGNPSNPGPSPGPSAGLSSLPSPSSTRSVHPAAFSMPDLTVGSGPGSGLSPRTGGPQRPPETSSKPESSASSQAHHSPSPLSLGESVSERGHQRQHPELQQRQPKQSARRSGIPNLPVQRSEWVMWVGNVPSDATHDELWRFFTRPIAPNIPLPAEPRSPYRQQHQPQPHLPAGLLSPTGSSSASDTSPADASGVQSVFLIARSNCAFVNFVSEAYLSAAVQRLNGVPLRPNDPRCPRLVCRVRGKEEDMRAGVGAQRGTGMHTRWVREQREKVQVQEKRDSSIDESPMDSEAYASDRPGSPLSVVVTETGTESSTQSSGRRAPHHSSSSGSTTSGFLARYFPKRYFILKSLTQYDLELSVKKGIWATQPHNETVLNQAYRNSSDVYLIFSVNKSGEFYGYAKMANPIGKTAVDRVSWASRSDSQHSHHSHSPTASFASGKGTQLSETIPEESENNPPEPKEAGASKGKGRETGSERPVMLFSPSEHRLAENSPQPVTPVTQKRLSTAQETNVGKVLELNEATSAPQPSQGKEPLPQSAGSLALPRTSPPTSAPAIMGPQYRPITSSRVENLASETLDPRMLRRHLPEVKLNPEAPYRAVRSHESHDESEVPSSQDAGRVKSRDTLHDVSGSSRISKLREVQGGFPDASGAELNAQKESADLSTQWGTPFKVQWIRTQRLPFSRTRHLRNPWNHEREVKVSRDGTELEPSVGQALLEEWDKLDAEPQSPAPPSGEAGITAAAGRRGPQYRRTQSSQAASIPESEAGPGPDSPRPHQLKQRPR